jgi:hypothetical protein
MCLGGIGFPALDTLIVILTAAFSLKFPSLCAAAPWATLSGEKKPKRIIALSQRRLTNIKNASDKKQQLTCRKV